MSTETTNKKIKIDNGTTFGKTYTDKAVDERLQGLVSTATFTPVKEKANNSLQKPKGLTKTKLVGVGANGQENIEIGDNLTLANGKLSATGGGGSVSNGKLVSSLAGKNNDVYELTKPLEQGKTYKGILRANVGYIIEYTFLFSVPSDKVANNVGCTTTLMAGLNPAGSGTWIGWGYLHHNEDLSSISLFAYLTADNTSIASSLVNVTTAIDIYEI